MPVDARGWRLGKWRPFSIRENGYLLSAPTPGTEQSEFTIHTAMPFIFSAFGICGLLILSPNLRPRALSRVYKAGVFEKFNSGEGLLQSSVFPSKAAAAGASPLNSNV